MLGAYVEELLGVARRYGLRYVHLAGHGFGAAVALEAAIALDGGSGSGSGQHSGRRPPRHSSPRLLSLALLSPAIDLPQWRLDAAYAESVLGDFSFTRSLHFLNSWGGQKERTEGLLVVAHSHIAQIKKLPLPSTL